LRQAKIEFWPIGGGRSESDSDDGHRPTRLQMQQGWRLGLRLDDIAAGFKPDALLSMTALVQLAVGVALMADASPQAGSVLTEPFYAQSHWAGGPPALAAA